MEMETLHLLGLIKLVLLSNQVVFIFLGCVIDRFQMRQECGNSENKFKQLVVCIFKVGIKSQDQGNNLLASFSLSLCRWL